MLCGGSRVLQHLSDHNHHNSIGLGLGFCGAKIVQLSSFFLRPSQAMAKSHHFSRKLRQRMISSFGSHCRTSGEVPILHNCFSQREDDPELPVEGLSPVSGIYLACLFLASSFNFLRKVTPFYSLMGILWLLCGSFPFGKSFSIHLVEE
jgi:hypothetical protein